MDLLEYLDLCIVLRDNDYMRQFLPTAYRMADNIRSPPRVD